MRNKTMIGLIAAVILSLMVGGFAQASPQSTATQGRFTSAADDFIETTDYTGVSFDKWFGFTSFAANNKAKIGYATKAGNIYIGAQYNGNFWNLSDIDYTEKNHRFFTEDKVFRTFTSLPNYTSSNSNVSNELAVLIGVADMGFRLQFTSTHESFKKSDITNGTAFYKNYQSEYGDITPQIAWGMAKDLTPQGIRPYASIDLVFHRDYLKREAYTSTTDTSGEQTSKSDNHFDPKLTVGLGGYTLYRENGFKLSADLKYELGLGIYDNEYSYMVSGKYATINIKGKTNATTTNEYGSANNVLTPSVGGSWSDEKLRLKFKLSLPLTLINEDVSTMIFDTVANKFVKNDKTYTTADFKFAPKLALGTQWKIIPEKLALNAGGAISLDTLQVKTEKGSTYTNDKEDAKSSYTETTTAFGSTSVQLTAGVTFNATSNLSFEASSGIVGTNAVSVFNSAGLLNFTEILVSLKF